MKNDGICDPPASRSPHRSVNQAERSMCYPERRRGVNQAERAGDRPTRPRGGRAERAAAAGGDHFLECAFQEGVRGLNQAER